MNFKEYGVDMTHHFGDREVIKETRIPAGIWLEQHVHEYSHLSVLVSGAVEVTVDGVTVEHRAPKVLNIAAGKKHKVLALVESVWLCVHGVPIINPLEVDRTILGVVESTS